MMNNLLVLLLLYRVLALCCQWWAGMICTKNSNSNICPSILDWFEINQDNGNNTVEHSNLHLIAIWSIKYCKLLFYVVPHTSTAENFQNFQHNKYLPIIRKRLYCCIEKSQWMIIENIIIPMGLLHLRPQNIIFQQYYNTTLGLISLSKLEMKRLFSRI